MLKRGMKAFKSAGARGPAPPEPRALSAVGSGLFSVTIRGAGPEDASGSRTHKPAAKPRDFPHHPLISHTRGLPCAESSPPPSSSAQKKSRA